MGNACAKLTPEQRAEIEKSRMIERMIEEERRAQLAESKLLLLGTIPLPLPLLLLLSPPRA